ASMQAPSSAQDFAHFCAVARAASGPSPNRRISSTPEITAFGSSCATPAGPVIGQTSTHLPHLVQASTIAEARASSASSNAVVLIGEPFAKRAACRQDTPPPGRWPVALAGTFSASCKDAIFFKRPQLWGDTDDETRSNSVGICLGPGGNAGPVGQGTQGDLGKNRDGFRPRRIGRLRSGRQGVLHQRLRS